jgi:hypothetical protein
MWLCARACTQSECALMAAADFVAASQSGMNMILGLGIFTFKTLRIPSKAHAIRFHFEHAHVNFSEQI